jgi:hypothetical protein
MMTRIIDLKIVCPFLDGMFHCQTNCHHRIVFENRQLFVFDAMTLKSVPSVKVNVSVTVRVILQVKLKLKLNVRARVKVKVKVCFKVELKVEVKVKHCSPMKLDLPKEVEWNQFRFLMN